MKEPESKSEVARLRQQIALEYEAMQRGLVGIAAGTALHRFIMARMERVGMYQDQLAKHVGEDEADRITCELYVDRMG